MRAFSICLLRILSPSSHYVPNQLLLHDSVYETTKRRFTLLNLVSGIARRLKKLSTSKRDYWIKQWFFNCIPFQNENFY